MNMQESIKEFPLERGAKAIASIEAASWFPVNITSSSSQLRESVSSDVSIWHFIYEMNRLVLKTTKLIFFYI